MGEYGPEARLVTIFGFGSRTVLFLSNLSLSEIIMTVTIVLVKNINMSI